MTTPSDETQRIKQRFDVDLKAEVSLAGKENQEHQCRITNLSASGACLQFETTIAVKTGMCIAIKIAIPSTIMHAPNSGEIKWVKQQHNKITTGVRFKEILSEIMMQQLTKNGSLRAHTSFNERSSILLTAAPQALATDHTLKKIMCGE